MNFIISAIFCILSISFISITTQSPKSKEDSAAIKKSSSKGDSSWRAYMRSFVYPSTSTPESFGSNQSWEHIDDAPVTTDSEGNVIEDPKIGLPIDYDISNNMIFTNQLIHKRPYGLCGGFGGLSQWRHQFQTPLLKQPEIPPPIPEKPSSNSSSSEPSCIEEID